MIGTDCQTSVPFSELVSKWRSDTASGQGTSWLALGMGWRVSALRGKVSFTSTFHQKKKTHQRNHPENPKKKLTSMDHPSMVPSSTIPSSSTCGPATPNIPVTSWLASGIGVRLSWSKMKTFWSVGILASWHLWGGEQNFQTKRNSGSAGRCFFV